MEDLSQLLTDAELQQLRSAYDAKLLLGANARGLGVVYPPLGPWGEAIGSLFFTAERLAPRDRELSLITLLTFRSPGVSLANHLYWGLMEGLTMTEICQAMGLAGCYCGLPTYTHGVFTAHKTLTVLKRLVAEGKCDSRSVLTELVKDLSGMAL